MFEGSSSKEAVEAKLAALREKVLLGGGLIVQYDRILSALIAAETRPVFEWIGPGESRAMAGVKHALFCVAFGFWSIPGLLVTPAIIVTNLMGGLNVTEAIVPPDGVRSVAGHLGPETTRHTRVRYVVIAAWVVLLVGLALSGAKPH